MKKAESPFKWRHFEPTIILLCVQIGALPAGDFKGFVAAAGHKQAVVAE